MVIAGIITVIAFTLFLAIILFRKKPALQPDSMPQAFRTILIDNVPFYAELDDSNKKTFENRMMRFISTVRITGVNTTVEDIDKVFIAAGAIIPIFGFPDWEYGNLNEVLVYPDTFNHETFDLNSNERNTLGVVGTGAYQNVMILSKNSLRDSFINKSGKGNVPIHEFVHLIDKTDGDTDGIPESIMGKQYVLPWLELMQKEIRHIVENRSDIDAYGITNKAEFFAVVSEYFFERPDLLKSKHPELYDLLANIFRQKPVQDHNPEI